MLYEQKTKFRTWDIYEKARQGLSDTFFLHRRLCVHPLL